MIDNAITLLEKRWHHHPKIDDLMQEARVNLFLFQDEQKAYKRAMNYLRWWNRHTLPKLESAIIISLPDTHRNPRQAAIRKEEISLKRNKLLEIYNKPVNILIQTTGRSKTTIYRYKNQIRIILDLDVQTPKK